MSFDNKDPLEEIICTMDFVEALNNAETITAATWSIQCLSETEITTAMISGMIDFTTQPLVKQKIVGGNLNQDYMHLCLITTSEGRKLMGAVTQKVTLGGL